MASTPTTTRRADVRRVTRRRVVTAVLGDIVFSIASRVTAVVLVIIT